MINIAFDLNGKRVSSVGSRSIPSDVLLNRWPDAVIVEAEYGEVQKMRAPITLVNGVITEAPPPTAQELADLQAEEVLLVHAEEEARKTREHIEDGVQDKSITTKADINAKFNRGA